MRFLLALNTARVRALWAAVLLVTLGPASAGPPPAQPVFNYDPSAVQAASPALIARGAAIYAKQCTACHGAQGKGDGTAAYLLYPKPRNFKTGPFRFTSTWEGVPTDDDLFRTVSRGIPGSAMPSWAHLPEADRWGLVHHIKSFAQEPIKIAAPKAADLAAGVAGEGIVAVPPEPKNDAASLARGAQLFAVNCTPCHGPLGRGDGPNATKLKDDDGFPIRPRDLNTGVFKGDPRPQHLYRRVVHGIQGTPMPQTLLLAGEDGWHVVHFVRSLSSDVLRERAEMKRFRIAAPKVAKVPDHPDAGEWALAPKVEIHLMPLWWRYDRPEFVTVRALHDGTTFALLLVWDDLTQNDAMLRPQDFRDAAAAQFSLDAEAPFFAMGEKGLFVNTWMWKAERQADLAGFHDLEAQYPNLGIDSYPNTKKTPYEQPARHALTLDSDPTFITAWGAGNIVADPTRRSAAEDLRAQGFGTLKARPLQDQTVRADGVYGYGSYRVVFRRALKPRGANAVDLASNDVAQVGFAVWNGAAGDRDGKKSVSIWQELLLLR